MDLDHHVDHPMAFGLDVRFINTLPVSAALHHSPESGNLGDERQGDERHEDWMPACVGMPFY
jgi:hypothetical protein